MGRGTARRVVEGISSRARRFGDLYDAPVWVDNDVNIMALGERSVAFPSVPDLVFVKVATGIASRTAGDRAAPNSTITSVKPHASGQARRARTAAPPCRS